MKPVHILSDAGLVDQDDIAISRNRGDQVTWFAYGTSGATIEFSPPDGSPFHDSTFRVPAAGSVTSGPVTSSALLNKRYKYTVEGPAGTNDPGVIIQN
jgi:hypothetical protein